MYKVCINLIYINVCVYYECGCSEMFVNKKTKLILRFAVSIFTYFALSQAPIDDLLQV